MGSGEQAEKRTSFKWAGARESMLATSEFQWTDCIGRMTRQASDGTRRIPFAIGDELSAISETFLNPARKFCCTAIMKRLT